MRYLLLVMVFLVGCKTKLPLETEEETKEPAVKFTAVYDTLNSPQKVLFMYGLTEDGYIQKANIIKYNEDGSGDWGRVYYSPEIFYKDQLKVLESFAYEEFEGKYTINIWKDTTKSPAKFIVTSFR